MTDSNWSTPNSPEVQNWKLGDPVPEFQYSWELAWFKKLHPEAFPKKKRNRRRRGGRLPVSGGCDQGQTPTPDSAFKKQ